MNRRATWYRGMTMMVLVAATATGCTIATPRMIGSGDVVADRQRIMKLQGASMVEIQDKMKAGNIAGIAYNADVIALTSAQIPSLFPEGSLSERSNAKPDIWQRWGEFEATAKNLTIWSMRLRDAARARDEKGVQDVLKDFGRVTCVACHDAFRKPLPR